MITRTPLIPQMAGGPAETGVICDIYQDKPLRSPAVRDGRRPYRPTFSASGQRRPGRSIGWPGSTTMPPPLPWPQHQPGADQHQHSFLVDILPSSVGA